MVRSKISIMKLLAVGISTIIELCRKYNDVLLQVKAKTLIGWAYLEMTNWTNALILDESA